MKGKGEGPSWMGMGKKKVKLGQSKYVMFVVCMYKLTRPTTDAEREREREKRLQRPKLAHETIGRKIN